MLYVFKNLYVSNPLYVLNPLPLCYEYVLNQQSRHRNLRRFEFPLRDQHGHGFLQDSQRHVLPQVCILCIVYSVWCMYTILYAQYILFYNTGMDSSYPRYAYYV
jgi:hypothetical protein